MIHPPCALTDRSTPDPAWVNEAGRVSVTPIPLDAQSAYSSLADDPRYRHFVRIPDRILCCIEHFRIVCDRASARRRLHSYYLFIGVVDDAIDSGDLETGKLVLEYLSGRSSSFAPEVLCSNVRLVTEVLKSDLDDETHSLMLKLFRELYEEVIKERAAGDMDSYLWHRNRVGSLTAELSYVLIRPCLSGNHQYLGRFMREVGAVGCLIDSLIDLGTDRRLSLVGFRPGIAGYAKLFKHVLCDGLNISVRHPGLSIIFLRAVVDNFLDRFRTSKRSHPDRFATGRKDHAPSAA